MECHGALDKVIVTLSREKKKGGEGDFQKKAAVFHGHLPIPGCKVQFSITFVGAMFSQDPIFDHGKFECFCAVGSMPQLICTFI